MAMSRSLGLASVTTRSPMVISPPRMSSETSRTACTPPGNCLLTCSRMMLPTWHLLAGWVLDAGEALVGERGPPPPGSLRRRAEPVEAEQGGTDHRRRGHLPEPGGRRDRGDPAADALQEGRVVPPEDAAAQDHVGVPVGQAEPADRR